MLVPVPKLDSFFLYRLQIQNNFSITAAGGGKEKNEWLDSNPGLQRDKAREPEFSSVERFEP